jgi:hypothetical protein
MNDHGQVAIAAAGTDRTCDPITLEIVRGALRATQSEMEALIEQPQSEKDVMAGAGCSCSKCAAQRQSAFGAKRKRTFEVSCFRFCLRSGYLPAS